MSRYAPRPAVIHYSFGPGPITPAVKWLIIANVVDVPGHAGRPAAIVDYLGLSPRAGRRAVWIWQLGTYMFLHGGFDPHPVQHARHLDVRRGAGADVGHAAVLLKYYAITGVGGGVDRARWCRCCRSRLRSPTAAITIGASGALYGLLLAFALYYPDRPILMFLLFPMPREVLRDDRRRDGVPVHVPNQARRRRSRAPRRPGHRLPLPAGGRGGLSAEIKYRYLKWKMNRLRRKFDVYSGGRSDWDRHVH